MAGGAPGDNTGHTGTSTPAGASFSTGGRQPEDHGCPAGPALIFPLAFPARTVLGRLRAAWPGVVSPSVDLAGGSGTRAVTAAGTSCLSVPGSQRLCVGDCAPRSWCPSSHLPWPPCLVAPLRSAGPFINAHTGEGSAGCSVPSRSGGSRVPSPLLCSTWLASLHERSGTRDPAPLAQTPQRGSQENGPGLCCQARPPGDSALVPSQVGRVRGDDSMPRAQARCPSPLLRASGVPWAMFLGATLRAHRPHPSSA